MRLSNLMLCAVLIGAIPLVSAPEVDASSRRAALKQAESSLSVSGDIEIDAAGRVVGYTLDHADTLPKGIADAIARLAPQWRFEPVALADDVVSRTRMHLLFIARKRDDGSIAVTLRSATFSPEQAENERVQVARRGRMPDYPNSLVSREINGTVYLVLKIGRDGKVAEIDATHVNLRTIGTEPEMARWRTMFAESSIKAIRGWTFSVPTAGESAADPYWIGSMPVSFNIDGFSKPRPDRWETYLPGPRKPIPWVDGLGLSADAFDALPADQLHMPKSGRRLIGPLGGS